MIDQVLLRLMPLAAIVLTLLIPIVALVGYYITRIRREKLWHETARVALEKGQPPPSYPPGESPRNPPPVGIDSEQWWRERRARKRESELQGGLILLGIGVALRFAGRDLTLPSYVLIGLGAALVLSILLTRSSHDRRGPTPPA